jgi:hypothetical protein
MTVPQEADKPNKYQQQKQDLMPWNVCCSVGGFFYASFSFVLLSVYLVLFVSLFSPCTYLFRGFSFLLLLYFHLLFTYHFVSRYSSVSLSSSLYSCPSISLSSFHFGALAKGSC